MSEILSHKQLVALVKDLRYSAADSGVSFAAIEARQGLLIEQFAALRLALAEATRDMEAMQVYGQEQRDRAVRAERERDEARAELATTVDGVAAIFGREVCEGCFFGPSPHVHLTDEDIGIVERLGSAERERDEAIRLRDLHWREVESLREWKDKLEAEVDEITALVDGWRNGRAHLGTPATFVDQRLLDGILKIGVSVSGQRGGTVTFSHWSGAATKPDEEHGDGGPPEE